MGNVMVYASIFRSMGGSDVGFGFVFLWFSAKIFSFFETRFDLGSYKFIPSSEKCKTALAF